MDRWVLRLAAYAGLMTDKYPPFRLDMGENDVGQPSATEIEPPLPPMQPAASYGAS
jgi:hypothetical protein